ncbi:1-(5-phosphoribosyl)-5-[(5-phosphoribosylamino)methylideneamino] imidazole-4-carboxamide isomerase [Calidithermus terrae]|uniref:1-(5-phosphoribosyl)-5-[(5-phosphoribosylamino)methylideneamino] imidazole-4-carboxamide isomerase n=1 Tax=Calidithermus terrae TaxID=1408545 RepID=A0A399EBN0_9DEIN|nr:1-(5-phosphoribosyl)-5-[(5-phosphoribosylamino)methylideneamino]imidazole-4-carboxamide isomerase [Calidithermus terrae]RIH81755.1 1-(5-phosphoribosyl)-5-[(5-phosphoribosylamino)methylideneamino] imidazole-4-carboxamide isomerase [Calidithermus terrae]
MLVIPAVDIQQGRAVRLFEGKPELETVYFEEPLEAALHWQAQGARFLHLVDLDAATGRGENRAVIRRVAERLEVPFEVGGGVRSLEVAQGLLELGAKRVVVGTVAVKRPEVLTAMLEAFGPERVAVSLDARGLEVVVSGWAEGTAQDVTELALRTHEAGVRTLIYTDVRRDGTLQGLDLEVVARVREAWPGFLIAGGGIASDADLEGLQRLGVEGAITGKALYEGRIDLGRWI